MTNSDILDTALRQSAWDCNCSPEDFKKTEHTLTRSQPSPQARRYLNLPHICNFVTYGAGIVASAGEGYGKPAGECLEIFPCDKSPYRLFETPGAHLVEEAFAPYGGSICFMAEYFLPDIDALGEKPCPFELRLLGRRDFQLLYIPQWSNALCSQRPQLDVLGVGAFDGGKMVALAGCSADCDSMWQIGVDVLPEYRKMGLATALTSRLALEILDRGKVPFYCAAWSNIASVRNAISSGFKPAWVELTVKTRDFVDGMNRDR